MNTNKNFDPASVKYGLLYKLSSKQVIPSLQRPYTWDMENINKLWKDIIENESPYFIGSLVLVAGEGSASRDEVIDGQQRLTTLSLMLIALRDYLLLEKKDEFLKEIKSLLLEPAFEGEPEPRLKFTNKISNDIYSKLVRGDVFLEKTRDDIENKFLENYRGIRNLLLESIKNKEITPKDLFGKICDLELINIICYAKTSGYKLFESLNATAESLASVDLIKNSLFMLLSKNEKILKESEEKWLLLESKFSESRSLFKIFIRHHWLSTIDYVNHSNLFEAFEKEYIKNSSAEQASEYLDSLSKDADTYLALRDANVGNLSIYGNVRFEIKEVERVLQFLKFLNVDQVYPILLYIYNNDPKNFRRYLIKLVSFQFLFKHVPGSPSAVEKYFAKFCKREIGNQELFQSLEKLCRNQAEQFEESFLSKVRYTKLNGDVQFILEQYLYHFGPGESHAKPTIEHIITQKPSSEYKQELLKKFDGDGSLFKRKIHEIGNLTILEKNTNTSSEVANLPYKEKKYIYTETNFLANEEILDYPFEENPLRAIGIRNQKISKDVYGIFLNSLSTGKLINRKK